MSKRRASTGSRSTKTASKKAKKDGTGEGSRKKSKQQPLDVAAVPEETDAVRHSTRVNIGSGGALAQMEAIALAIKPTKKTRKKRVNDVPSNEGSNPMAPANTKPVRGGTKTGKESTSSTSKSKPSAPKPKLSHNKNQPPIDTQDGSAEKESNPQPTHLVLVGTKPPLPGQTYHENGHTFGFHAHSTGSGSGPSSTVYQPQKQARLKPNKQTTIPLARTTSALDPSLNEQDKDAQTLESSSEDDDNGSSSDPDDEDDDQDGFEDQQGSWWDLLKLLQRINAEWFQEPEDDDANVFHNFGHPNMNPGTEEEHADADEESRDVLKEHHHKNRTPKAPSASLLEQFQPSKTVTSSTTSHTDSNSSDTESDDEEFDKTKCSQRARRRSKATGQACPTQLQFYPSLWAKVLERGKMYFRRHLLLKSSFPSRAEVKVELGDCLTQAMAVHEAEGGEVEDGYYPRYQKAMHTLIWQDSSTFHSELKKAAHVVVHAKYNIFPGAEAVSKMTVKQQRKAVKRNVANLLQGGAFMHDRKDDQNCTNNLTNPAIAELAQTFLYSTDKSMGQFFPEQFHQVPQMAVALMIAALKCSLKEWKEGSRSTIKFSKEKYAKVVKNAIKVITQVEADPYHNAKFQHARRQWASCGIAQAPGDDDDDDDNGAEALHAHLD